MWNPVLTVAATIRNQMALPVGKKPDNANGASDGANRPGETYPAPFNDGGIMATQMHSLREQPKALRELKHFQGDEEQISLWEAVGWAVLCASFFGTMFAFLGG